MKEDLKQANLNQKSSDSTMKEEPGIELLKPGNFSGFKPLSNTKLSFGADDQKTVNETETKTETVLWPVKRR